MDLDLLKQEIKHIILDMGANLVGVGNRERLKENASIGGYGFLLGRISELHYLGVCTTI